MYSDILCKGQAGMKLYHNMYSYIHVHTGICDNIAESKKKSFSTFSITVASSLIILNLHSLKRLSHIARV